MSEAKLKGDMTVKVRYALKTLVFVFLIIFVVCIGFLQRFKQRLKENGMDIVLHRPCSGLHTSAPPPKCMHVFHRGTACPILQQVAPPAEHGHSGHNLHTLSATRTHPPRHARHSRCVMTAEDTSTPTPNPHTHQLLPKHTHTTAAPSRALARADIPN